MNLKPLPKNIRNFDKWLKEYIQENEMVSKEEIKEMQMKSIEKAIPFHELVLENKILNSIEILDLVKKVTNYEVINLEEFTMESEVVNILHRDFMLKNNVIPISIDRDSKKILIAMSDPSNLMVLDETKRITKLVANPVFAIHSQIRNIIDRNEKESNIHNIIEEMNNMSVNIEDNKIEEVDNINANSTDEPAVNRMINSILSDAISSGASDIHIEPFENFIRVRFRIDGLLVEKIKHMDKQALPTIVTKIKVLSGMDISEHRRPQDGRFRVTMHNFAIDIRVSTMQTQYGEKIVMRLTNKNINISSMDSLNLEPEEKEQLIKATSNPYGLILVTGPTGSGKTTTLYVVLSNINKIYKNIVTIEDPIEYQLHGIIQTTINTKADLTFATGLRTILRQDPDIIMVGEIRDNETAEIVTKASMTGHLVLSTLHTNDAPSSITRLIDMGIEPFKITSSLITSVAQRLIRKTCEHCKEEYTPSIEELALLRNIAPHLDIQDNIKLYRSNPNGCPKCNKTGYKGRIGLYEILNINEDIRKLILNRASSDAIKEKAIELGMETMEVKGVKKILKGITTIEELTRVIFIS